MKSKSSSDKKPSGKVAVSKKTMGGVAGAIVGTAVAGPVGGVAGAIAGASRASGPTRASRRSRRAP